MSEISIGNNSVVLAELVESFTSTGIESAVVAVMSDYSKAAAHWVRTPDNRILTGFFQDNGFGIKVHQVTDGRGKKCDEMLELAAEATDSPREALDKLMRKEVAPGFYLFSDIVVRFMSRMTDRYLTIPFNESLIVVDRDSRVIWKLTGPNSICLAFS